MDASTGSPPERRTRHLLLRRTEPSDVDPLFAIQGDPVAMRFTYCAPSREATAARLAAYAARFAEDGFAPWTALLAEEILILCIRDRQVVAQRGIADSLTALRQLGVIPMPSGGEAS
jgi:RimJ/RimL family protein N-acetyltransferase